MVASLKIFQNLVKNYEKRIIVMRIILSINSHDSVDLIIIFAIGEYYYDN